MPGLEISLPAASDAVLIRRRKTEPGYTAPKATAAAAAPIDVAVAPATAAAGSADLAPGVGAVSGAVAAAPPTTAAPLTTAELAPTTTATTTSDTTAGSTESTETAQAQQPPPAKAKPKSWAALLSRDASTTPVATAATAATTVTTAAATSLAPLVGLRNEGNTCFMNAPLQLLAAVTPLRQELVSGVTGRSVDFPASAGTRLPLCEAYKALLVQLTAVPVASRPAKTPLGAWLRQQPALSAADVYAAVLKLNPALRRTKQHAQHDAEELMGFLLHTMHEELARAARKRGGRDWGERLMGREGKSDKGTSEG